MKKIIVCIIMSLLAVSLQAAQINSSWDGGGDGSSWADPSNWNPDIVPDNNGTDTFAVTVDGSGNIYLVQDRTVDQLTCYNTVEFLIWPNSRIWLRADQLINNGKLNFDDNVWFYGDVFNYGDLEMGADAEVEGNITNHNYFKVSGGVEISGSFTNKSGANALLPWDGDSIDIGGDIKNEPNALITMVGSIGVYGNFDNAGKISLRDSTVEIDGIFDNDVSGAVMGSGRVVCIPPIHNKGTILALKGVLEIQSSLSITNSGVLGNAPSATLYIEADVVVNDGIVRVNVGGSVWSNCNVINNSNGIIELLGGTLSTSSLTQSQDAGFIGFGSISGNVIIEDNGIFQLTGPTNIVGDVSVGTNAILEISDGTTLVTGVTTNNGTIHMKGGRIIPQGGFTNTTAQHSYISRGTHDFN